MRPAKPSCRAGRANAAPTAYCRRDCPVPVCAGTTAVPAQRTVAADHRGWQAVCEVEHGPRARASIWRASSRIVCAVKIVVSGSMTPNVSRIRDINCVARSEWPPSSKKLSSVPTASRRSSRHHSAASSSSVGVRASRRVCRDFLGFRQRTTINFAAARQWKLFEDHEMRRHHVAREHVVQVLAHRGERGPPLRR